MTFCGKLLLLCALATAVTFISSCDDYKVARRTSSTITMSGKTFQMPDNRINYWWRHDRDSNWVNFRIDARTGIPQPYDSKDFQNSVFIRFGSIESMNRTTYWTDRDAELHSSPVAPCKKTFYAGVAYEQCDHGWLGDSKAHRHLYQLHRTTESGRDTTVITCSERLTSLPNPSCSARMTIDSALQVNYSYNVSYFELAEELNEKIRSLVSDIYNP